MISMPAFCTLASLLVLLFAALAQAAAPYYITGRTFPVHTCFRMLLLAPHLEPASLFIGESLFLAFFSTSLIRRFKSIMCPV